MTQTKLQSLLETTSGTAVAFAGSIVTGMVVYPLYGHKFSLGELGWITFWFTVVSFIRSYLWRRFFNWLHRWQAIRQIRARIAEVEEHAPADCCMCGSPMDHSAWDAGHTPVSMRDYHTTQLRQELIKLGVKA